MKNIILSEICRENIQRAFIVKYCIQFNIYGKYDAVQFVLEIFSFMLIFDICSEYIKHSIVLCIMFHE